MPSVVTVTGVVVTRRGINMERETNVDFRIGNITTLNDENDNRPIILGQEKVRLKSKF